MAEQHVDHSDISPHNWGETEKTGDEIRYMDAYALTCLRYISDDMACPQRLWPLCGPCGRGLFGREKTAPPEGLELRALSTAKEMGCAANALDMAKMQPQSLLLIGEAVGCD
ncbi:hypothetical protein H113_07999 [Trichophyton rubrum MR1459]|uniref:Uncharacterized protein n=2 Tax=Trichophyton TaxID=5550 RepID=A0A022VQQ8_TRIRU|nr:hypothetical protein H100_07951 [Trichophyton rubrum MR850]EZF37599.1 hypothetical protein H102_07912 [Trichophyton rubrum CBS 100081]EZF48279.1 hypothetical protein H103_07937 [Trichophyton rubrum CBS 288.86]EZF59150.1 hypothetical protein H104_07884 [Trichophyton rubrum CBS 289.86]EZF69640.1 hypothetical protein H105_07937 [Trichophyton soudanense CBS 452.61]EZF80333.1 hypothetical protein H110_07936 [Trichophyton rubrum MR1448]EZF90816.1 hypothetical protein H113_07999 [Trichophyton rub